VDEKRRDSDQEKKQQNGGEEKRGKEERRGESRRAIPNYTVEGAAGGKRPTAGKKREGLDRVRERLERDSSPIGIWLGEKKKQHTYLGEKEKSNRTQRKEIHNKSRRPMYRRNRLTEKKKASARKREVSTFKKEGRPPR